VLENERATSGKTSQAAEEKEQSGGLREEVKKRTKKSSIFPEATTGPYVPRSKRQQARMKQTLHQRVVATLKGRKKLEGMLQGTIPVVVGDKAVSAQGLVDTGADVSMIDKEFAKSVPEFAACVADEKEGSGSAKSKPLRGIGGSITPKERQGPRWRGRGCCRGESLRGQAARDAGVARA
jgi:hypothetical protein